MDIALKLYKQQALSKSQELLAGCIRGERIYQKELYQKYYGRMMAVCLRYTNNREEARDILNEGFMKVFKNLAKYEPNHSLEAWIKRIMINTSIDHYRKNKKLRNNVDIEYASTQPAEDNVNIVSQLSAEEILKLVQRLTPAYRTVFNLYVIEGYNHREIGEKLGISEGTSKSNLAKARGKLRAMIKTDLKEYSR
ncbi:MAG: sigma-70 family RNA polymerase sigma factor [Chitinophagales bacterium]